MRHWILIGGLALLGFTPSAQAQDDQVEAASSTSPKEKLDWAADAIVEMNDGVKTVEKLQEQVTRSGDEELIQCVRIKMASVRALADVSVGANAAMTDALADGNDERAEFEFRKIAIGLSKVRQFVAEAEACVGQGGTVDGDTEVSVNSQGIAEGDDTEESSTDGIIGNDPPDASAFE
ncbi:MAG: hypothetical protein P8R54_08670 [Myxococcota bacterium]|nr:hypothetical protein [Myxococcota bacterium]